MFVIEGEITIENKKLGKRDGLGVSETKKFKIQAKDNSRILLMEVPININ